MFDKYDGVVMVRCRYSFDVKNDRQHAFSHNKTTHNITQTRKGYDITTSPHHNSTGRWGAFLARLLKMLMCMFFLHAADQGMSSRQLQLGSVVGQFRRSGADGLVPLHGRGALVTPPDCITALGSKCVCPGVV